MFESVRRDPGEEGLTKAGRIFYVLAVLAALGALLQFGLAIAARVPPPLLPIIINFILAGACVVIGSGIDKQRRWALWLGYAVAVLELLNVPIGTVIGIALIVYLYRANKAGLFTQPAP
jgi:hypothetical protein